MSSVLREHSGKKNNDMSGEDGAEGGVLFLTLTLAFKLQNHVTHAYESSDD